MIKRTLVAHLVFYYLRLILVSQLALRGKISKQLRKTFCNLSNNTMAWGLQNLSKSQSFTSEVGSLGGGRHYEEPGSRDYAVLVVLSILSLSFSLGAGYRVVGDVRYPHAAVRSSRG